MGSSNVRGKTSKKGRAGPQYGGWQGFKVERVASQPASKPGGL